MNPQTLIAVDPNALADISNELARLHRRLDQVKMTQNPEWVTVNEYAALKKINRRTVIRKIEAGKVETQYIDGDRMVRVNLAA
jgi:hypothetical protein